MPDGAKHRIFAVDLSDNEVSLYAPHYDQIVVPSLLRASHDIRWRVLRAVERSGLPITFAPHLFTNSYHWAEAMRFLPKSVNPTEAELRRSWKKIVENLDSEPLDRSDDGDEQEEQFHVYGIGEYTDFCDLAPSIVASSQALKRRDLRACKRVDRIWTDIAQRIEALRKTISKLRIRDISEQRDGRPLHEALIVSFSAADTRLAHRFFEMTNDGSGEIPSLWFDTRDDQTLFSATAYAKLASGVFSLIEHGEKQVELQDRSVSSRRRCRD